MSTAVARASGEAGETPLGTHGGAGPSALRARFSSTSNPLGFSHGLPAHPPEGEHGLARVADPAACEEALAISCVDRVLFATPQRGLAFGANWGDVYETTDDAQFWTRLDVTGVSAIRWRRPVGPHR